MINRIRSYFRHLFRWRKWRKQLRKLPLEFIKIKSEANEFSSNGKILVIAPHADDELIGCHKIISCNAVDTTVFYCGFLGTNSTEENRKVREREIRNYVVSQHCGIFVSSPERINMDLSGLINEMNPDVICLPSVVDWHPEHRQINYLLGDVLSTLAWQGQILWYHVSLPIPAQYVNCYSKMSRKQHSRKWNMMKRYYTSQLHMDIMRFRFVERALQRNAFAFESYIVQDYSQWKKTLDNPLSKTINEEDIKQSLGDIKKMFCYTSDNYKKILKEK